MITKQNDDLAKIYDYFGLNSALDGRLIVKANIMKKTIFFCMQWTEGYEKEWIDRIATRTCVSTRKIREDYVQPLVTEGILQRFAHGQIRFVGLPNGVSISTREESETPFKDYVQQQKKQKKKAQ
jgi:hypothetical protein